MTEMEGEMQRRVYHVRAYEQIDDPYRAMFGWRMLHYGGVTVVLEREREADGWLASVVVCSPLDKFCKRTGIRIADVRMRSHRAGKTVNNVVETGETDTRHAVANAIHEVVSHYHGSKRRQDVRQWVIEHVLAPLDGHEKPTMA